MGWRIRVVHETGYKYSSPVHETYNEVRLTPRSDSHQNVIVSRVETTPATRSYRYEDYWGTQVTAFDLHAPHTQLQVTGISVVETGDDTEPVRETDWAELVSEPIRDRYTEMLEFTDYVSRDPELSKVAKGIKKGKDPAEAVLAACDWVRDTMTYQSGTTGVHTSAAEAWQAGKGVCQDYAHLTLVLLREMGIPARYVSGYLLPRKDVTVGDTVSGQSHAWIEARTGGWWGFDPTNGIPIGARHVWVAVGRDYADVSPLKGIYSGGTAEALDVTVKMTRLA